MGNSRASQPEQVESRKSLTRKQIVVWSRELVCTVVVSSHLTLVSRSHHRGFGLLRAGPGSLERESKCDSCPET
jgi:hypothetical protein